MGTYDVVYREGPRDPVVRREMKGQAEALVRRDLESRGCSVLAIMQRKEQGVGAFLKRLLKGQVGVSLRFGVSTAELAMLCEVLKALYASGVPLLRALELTISETPNAWLRKRLVITLEHLREGDDVYRAMSDRRCRKAFPSLMRETIRTGEMNGRLDMSLGRLGEIYKRASETKREIISALLYPAIAFIVFIVVCTIIAILVPNALEEAVGKNNLIKVMPRLPVVIRFLFFLRNNPVFLIAPPSFIALFSFLWFWGKRWQRTRIPLTKAERKIPMVGSVLYEFALVRFLDLLAANNETGIQVAESLHLIQGSVGDALIERSLGVMRDRILVAGASLSESMEGGQEKQVFPGLARQMIRAGEESGRLTEMLLPIISFYSEQAKATLKRTLDMLTPGMIILLGSVIGPVLIGVYKTLILLQDVSAFGA